MDSLERQITQGPDDGFIYWYASRWNYNSGENYFRTGAYGTTSTKQSSWLEFRNIQIPPGAVIDAAKLTLIAYIAGSGNPVKTKIRAVAEDSPSPPASANDYVARTLTTHETLWDNIQAWTLGQSYNSPDFKDVIQEIINREGWQQGNNILIYWDDLDDRSTHASDCIRTACSYEKDAATAAKLTIEYHVPPTVPEIDTLDATGIKSDEAMLHTKVVDDMGKTLSVRHNYGKTTAYGTNTPWQEGKHTNDIISQKITDLDPETEYHFRGEAVFED